jgi:thiamine pyrophosphate-dependent acetolactate synthase large subunit-like protein
MPLLKPQSANFFVLLIALSVLLLSNEKVAPQEPATASQFDVIAKDIQQQVKSLGYADDVGKNLVKMVNDWKCVEWKQKLDKAKQDLREKKISADQITQVEIEVIKYLYQMIGTEFTVVDGEEYFYLSKVLNSPLKKSFNET